MQAMLGASTADADYQSLQHFITHSPWDHRAVWKRLWGLIPDRAGVLLLDDTGFPKQGTHSVGVGRQYCPPLGKVANCQIAVSSVLRCGDRSWPLAMELYVPEEWLEDRERRDDVGIPAATRFRPKWQIALAQVVAAKRAGFSIEAVVADSAYGDVTELRERLERLRLRYVMRVKGELTVFAEQPRYVTRRRRGSTGRPPVPRLARDASKPISLEKIAESLKPRDFKPVTWGKGSKGPLRSWVVVRRVVIAHRWQKRRPRKPCWLLIERTREGYHKFYFSNLAESASVVDLVRTGRVRWAVEQNFQQQKEELGLDHFEGRTWFGWNHHTVLTAMAFTFLQLERRRRRSVPTIPAVRRALSELITILVLSEQPSLRRLMQRGFGRDPPLN